MDTPTPKTLYQTPLEFVSPNMIINSDGQHVLCASCSPTLWHLLVDSFNMVVIERNVLEAKLKRAVDSIKALTDPEGHIWHGKSGECTGECRDCRRVLEENSKSLGGSAIENERLFSLLNQHDHYEVAPRITVGKRDHGWVVYLDAMPVEVNSNHDVVYHHLLQEALMAADGQIHQVWGETGPVMTVASSGGIPQPCDNCDRLTTEINAIVAKRDECLAQNADMVLKLKTLHDENELLKAKLSKTMDAISTYQRAYFSDGWTCQCEACLKFKDICEGKVP